MFSTKRLVFALLCLLVLVSFAPVPTPAALRVAGVPLVGPEIACAQPIQVCDPKDDPGCEDEDQNDDPGKPPNDPQPCNWEALATSCASCIAGNTHWLIRAVACARCAYHSLRCGL